MEKAVEHAAAGLGRVHPYSLYLYILSESAAQSPVLLLRVRTDVSLHFQRFHRGFIRAYSHGVSEGFGDWDR